MPDLIDHARSRALLIATTVSADPMVAAMPTAAGSLAGMVDVLTDPALCGWPGTSVAPIRDASDARDLEGTLRTLAAEAEETLLVYFAGPGILLSHDELCLGLASTRRCDAEDSSVQYARVRRAVLRSRARLKIVILDCSYSGRVIPDLPGIRVAEMTMISETYVLTASDREADPGDASGSAFTAELVAAIRAGIPGGPPTLTLDDLYPPLADRLRQAGRPVPNRESTGLAGHLPFTRNAGHGPRPRPSSASPSPAASSGQAMSPRGPARAAAGSSSWPAAQAAIAGPAAGPPPPSSVLPHLPGSIAARSPHGAGVRASGSADGQR